MKDDIKTVELIDFPDVPKVRVSNWRPSYNEGQMLQQGAKVLVQTPKSRDLHFYIVLEVSEQCREGFIGKVVGQEGYEGPLEVIYPGEYLKFEFDGLSDGDQIWFDEKNVANVF
jgi:hypothetical protein